VSADLVQGPQDRSGEEVVEPRVHELQELAGLEAELEQQVESVRHFAESVGSLLTSFPFRDRGVVSAREGWDERFLPALEELEGALTSARKEIMTRIGAILDRGA
jgi:hypothetical protein